MSRVDELKRMYPHWAKPRKRMVLRCTWNGVKYHHLIGKIIRIHYFSTFGAWDTKGNWFYYYDLSIPVSFWRHPLIYLGLAGITTTEQFRKNTE